MTANVRATEPAFMWPLSKTSILSPSVAGQEGLGGPDSATAWIDSVLKHYRIADSQNSSQNQIMKKKFIELITFTFASTAFCLLAYADPPAKNLRECAQNSDCVVVDGAYCGCAVTGAQNQFAVNKKNKVKAEKKDQSERENGRDGCLAGFSDVNAKKCANLRPVCVDAVCEVR